jgi:AcrR family transcriptional regulator
VSEPANLERLPSTGLGGRRKRRPERHDEILRAGVTLFCTRGYHATSIEDIAGAVGVSTAAIYRHFRSKQEILDTAALWASDQLVSRLLASAPDDSAERRLVRYVDQLVDELFVDPNFTSLFAHELGSISADVREKCLEARAVYVKQWSETLMRFAPGVTPSEARLRVHMAIGLVWSVPAFRGRIVNSHRDVIRAAAMGALTGGLSGDSS